LSDDKKRKAYDEDRKKKKKMGLLLQKEIGEEFEEGAYRDDGVEDEEDEEESGRLEPMSDKKQAILIEMEPLIRKALQPGGKDVMPKLKELDEKMRQQNKEDGVFATNHCPPIKYIDNTRNQHTKLLQITNQKVESEKDCKEIRDAESKLEALKEAVSLRMDEAELPPSWTIIVPPKRQNLVIPTKPEPPKSKEEPNSPRTTDSSGRENGVPPTNYRRPSVSSHNGRESAMDVDSPDASTLFIAPNSPTKNRWSDQTTKNRRSVERDIDAASDMDLDFPDPSALFVQQAPEEVPGYGLPLFSRPGASAEGDRTTVGWTGRIGTKYINRYGNKSVARYRLEVIPDDKYDETCLLEEDNVSNPDNRLGDKKIGTKYKYTRRHVRGIHGVAWPCVGTGPSKDDLSLLDPDADRKRWVRTHVLVHWQNCVGEKRWDEMRWETRTALRVRWSSKQADKAIYIAACEAERRYKESTTGKRAVEDDMPLDGLNDDFVRRMREKSVPPPASSLLEPATSTPPKQSKNVPKEIRKAFHTWRDEYLLMADVEDFTDFDESEKLDMMAAWKLHQSRLDQAV
jgi:hypothetical protein